MRWHQVGRHYAHTVCMVDCCLHTVHAYTAGVPRTAARITPRAYAKAEQPQQWQQLLAKAVNGTQTAPLTAHLRQADGHSRAGWPLALKVVGHGEPALVAQLFQRLKYKGRRSRQSVGHTAWFDRNRRQHVDCPPSHLDRFLPGGNLAKRVAPRLKLMCDRDPKHQASRLTMSGFLSAGICPSACATVSGCLSGRGRLAAGGRHRREVKVLLVQLGSSCPVALHSAALSRLQWLRCWQPCR